MLQARHLVVIAFAVVFGLASAAAPDVTAQDTIAHYVSLDDLQYMQDGLITPVHESVEITRAPGGPDRIEVGYRHIGMSCYWLIG